MDTLTNDLYAKKIIFTRVFDDTTLSNTHYSYLYDYGITGDDMIQLTEEDKEKILGDSCKNRHIYCISEEYIYITPEKIEIIDKSTTSNNWAYDDVPIYEIDEWTCIGNTEWHHYDDDNNAHQS